MMETCLRNSVVNHNCVVLSQLTCRRGWKEKNIMCSEHWNWNIRQGQDSPSLKLYYVSLWLSLFQWKTLLVEKTEIVELDENSWVLTWWISPLITGYIWIADFFCPVFRWSHCSELSAGQQVLLIRSSNIIPVTWIFNCHHGGRFWIFVT